MKRTIMKPEVRWLLAKIISRYYKTGREPIACACIGFAECQYLGCVHWWDQFLQLHPHELDRIVQLWAAAKYGGDE